MPDIQSMIGKEVEVIANGMRYVGVLIEVSDVEVHLRTSMQWIALPVTSVSEVRPLASRVQTIEQPSEENQSPGEGT